MRIIILNIQLATNHKGHLRRLIHARRKTSRCTASDSQPSRTWFGRLRYLPNREMSCSSMLIHILSNADSRNHFASPLYWRMAPNDDNPVYQCRKWRPYFKHGGRNKIYCLSKNLTLHSGLSRSPGWQSPRNYRRPAAQQDATRPTSSTAWRRRH